MNKPIKILMFSMAIGFFITSCNKEDEVNAGEKIANEQNAKEDTEIAFSLLDQDITISGANKLTGSLPTSTVEIDYEVSALEAFINTGFEVFINSNEELTGAYIRFLAVDGTASNVYYDVRLHAPNFRVLEDDKSQSNIFSARKLETAYSSRYYIEFHFGTKIPPGQFDYEICLYDAENNISQVQKVRVKVEAWGGNAELVGTWIFDSVEPNSDESYAYTINCGDGKELIADDYIVQGQSIEMALSEDGSYYLIAEQTYKGINYVKSMSSCTAVYDLLEDNAKYIGSWAFNVDDQNLNLVFFEVIDYINPEFSAKYERGAIHLQGAGVKVVNDELTLTITEMDYDESVTRSLIFKRK